MGSLWGIGIGIVQILLPAAVVVLLPAVLRIDPELGAAAATLGARPLTVFLRVTLPQLRVGIVAAFAACFALTMAAFADPAILGRGLKNFVSNFLQDRYLGLGNPPQGAAIGIVLLLIVSLGTAVILVLGRAAGGAMKRVRVAGVVTVCALIPLLAPTLLVVIASLSDGRGPDVPAAAASRPTGTARCSPTRRCGRRSATACTSPGSAWSSTSSAGFRRRSRCRTWAVTAERFSRCCCRWA